MVCSLRWLGNGRKASTTEDTEFMALRRLRDFTAKGAKAGEVRVIT